MTQLPSWFEICSFGSLKETLIGLVVAALAVFFFSVVMEDSEPMRILVTGGGVALVILALTAFMTARPHKEAEKEAEPAADRDPSAPPAV